MVRHTEVAVYGRKLSKWLPLLLMDW